MTANVSATCVVFVLKLYIGNYEMSMYSRFNGILVALKYVEFC